MYQSAGRVIKASHVTPRVLHSVRRILDNDDDKARIIQEMSEVMVFFFVAEISAFSLMFLSGV